MVRDIVLAHRLRYRVAKGGVSTITSSRVPRRIGRSVSRDFCVYDHSSRRYSSRCGLPVPCSRDCDTGGG
jgi:hypothetical protein